MIRQSVTPDAGAGVFSTAKMPADMLVAGLDFILFEVYSSPLYSEYSGDLIDSASVRNESSPFLYWFEKRLTYSASQWIDGATTFGIAPILNHSDSPNCVTRSERVNATYFHLVSTY
jgi:SET domain-containing protein